MSPVGTWLTRRFDQCPRCAVSGHSFEIIRGRRFLAVHDQPADGAALARIGSAIRPKDASHAGGSLIGAAGRCNGALMSIVCLSPVVRQQVVSFAHSMTV